MLKGFRNETLGHAWAAAIICLHKPAATMPQGTKQSLALLRSTLCWNTAGTVRSAALSNAREKIGTAVSTKQPLLPPGRQQHVCYSLQLQPSAATAASRLGGAFLLHDVPTKNKSLLRQVLRPSCSTRTLATMPPYRLRELRASHGGMLYEQLGVCVDASQQKIKSLPSTDC